MTLKLNHMYRLILILTLFIYGCNAKKSENNQEEVKTKKEVKKELSKRILFFGNSLTAGYGLSMEESFPLLIQSKIDSLGGLSYTCINAGISGETTTTGLSRLPWVLKQGVDVFVLELGANDGLRGIDVETTKANLIKMIELVKEKYPNAKIILAGMQVPPNMGEKYSTDFRQVYFDIAESIPELTFIPFLLEGVAGITELNQADGIHPTKEGAEIVTETVWKYIKPLL